jgi:hypothetical protein
VFVPRDLPPRDPSASRPPSAPFVNRSLAAIVTRSASDSALIFRITLPRGLARAVDIRPLSSLSIPFLFNDAPDSAMCRNPQALP